MGMPIIVDVRDEAAEPRRARPGVRLVPRGRPDVQHVQARQRDQLAEPRRARDPRRACRRARGAAALRGTAGRDERRVRRAGGVTAHRPVGLRQGLVGRSRRRDPAWARRGELLDQRGRRSCLLAGAALPEPRWRVGIQHPLRRDRLAKVVEGSDLAVATSGAYERGGHVLDARTGLAPAGVLSVTVTGPELGTADAFATAAYCARRGRSRLDADAAGARLRGADDPLRRRSAFDPGLP